MLTSGLNTLGLLLTSNVSKFDCKKRLLIANNIFVVFSHVDSQGLSDVLSSECIVRMAACLLDYLWTSFEPHLHQIRLNLDSTHYPTQFCVGSMGSALIHQNSYLYNILLD